MSVFPKGTGASAERRLTPEPERKLPADPIVWVREALDEHLWSKQREILRALVEHRKVAVQSCHQIGKALALDTPLPTPIGWTTMGDVRPGDWLLDEAGRPCCVREVSRPFEARPRYRVVFDDGTSVVADAEHEWSVTRFRARATVRAMAGVNDWRDEHAAIASVVTTRGLRGALRTSWGQRDAAVPLVAPLQLPARRLPVDPYVLGLYLADGTRANGGITVARHEAEWIEPRLGGRRVPSTERPGSFTVRVPGLCVKLRALGALDPKRIPPLYARASYKQRLALLRGIMDGDGFAHPPAAAGIDLTHELLALDVIELMRSLGLRPTVRTAPAMLEGRRVGTRWRIAVALTGDDVFSLPAKRRPEAMRRRCGYTMRTVVAVEPVEPGVTQCVEVDSPSHLFLCGEGMIPTHNSYIASRAAAWWVAAHPVGEVRLVSTAPSGDQVGSILWAEIEKAHRRGNLPGRITGGNVPKWMVGKEQIGQGRKPADYVDLARARTGFQGLHARYLLGVLDEACGIPLWLWQAMDTLATNDSSRLLAIGNPDDPTTEFAKVCAPGSGWHVISIGAFESPNFTGEAVPEQLRESLISKRWVDETRERYGEDSAYYVSKVLGEWPEDASDAIISPRLVREAHERDLSGNMIGTEPRFGMDVAREGGDESCIYENRGGVIRFVDGWLKADLAVATNRARNVLMRDRHRQMVVDAVGIGAGVYDNLRHEGFNALPYGGGEAAWRAERFVNRNAEAWWAFREGLETGQIDLDPADEVLAAQLQARKWDHDTAQRRVEIEKKSDMAKRGVKSPDRADAAVMSYYEGVSVPDPSVVLNTRADRRLDDSITGDLLHVLT